MSGANGVMVRDLCARSLMRVTAAIGPCSPSGRSLTLVTASYLRDTTAAPWPSAPADTRERR